MSRVQLLQMLVQVLQLLVTMLVLGIELRRLSAKGRETPEPARSGARFSRPDRPVTLFQNKCPVCVRTAYHRRLPAGSPQS